MGLNILTHSDDITASLEASSYKVTQTYCRNTIDELLASYKSESNEHIVVNYENTITGERNEAGVAYTINQFMIYVMSKAMERATVPSDFFSKLDGVFDLLESNYDIRYDYLDIDNYAGQYNYAIIKIEIKNL